MLRFELTSCCCDAGPLTSLFAHSMRLHSTTYTTTCYYYSQDSEDEASTSLPKVYLLTTTTVPFRRQCTIRSTNVPFSYFPPIIIALTTTYHFLNTTVPFSNFKRLSRRGDAASSGGAVARGHDLLRSKGIRNYSAGKNWCVRLPGQCRSSFLRVPTRLLGSCKSGILKNLINNGFLIP